MSHPTDSSRSKSTSSALNFISDEVSSIIRRFVAVLVGAWLGAILMLALIAPAAFRSVDSTFKTPPPVVNKAMKALGEPQVHSLLRYQVGEANRLMFETWGTAQLVLSGVVFFLLLFFSNVRRTPLGLSFLLMLMAAGMNFLLIPRIVETGRVMHSSADTAASAANAQFRSLHVAFSSFEGAAAVLGAALLVLLLRRRRGSHGSRRGGSRSGDAIENA